MKRTKRIYFNRQKTKYCIVRVYKTKSEMRKAYKKYNNHSIESQDLRGAHCGHEKYQVSKNGKMRLMPETGILFLNYNDCGAGIICHELMHAVLWAHNHRRNKKQFPIIIKNMEEEETILYTLTFVVRQFYNWLYSIESYFKKQLKSTIMSKKHPGFKAVQNKIAKKEGLSKKAAGAVLAKATRNASPAAKAKNKNLKKVK